MDFQSLKVFVVVAETGSFSQAAEQLFMTQPAISKRVAALESYLDAPLFDRLGRGIQLTEAGQQFLLSSRRIISDMEISREQIRSLSKQPGGRLRLATSHHVGIHRLPPVLKTFTQENPQVELDLLFMDSEQACAEVANGHLELAIVTLPDSLEANLSTQLVWPDPLTIVCANDHPLVTDRQSLAPIKPQLLGQHKAVLPARGTVTREILLSAMRPYGVSIDTTLETNYLETIKMMVSVGLGWSALPASMVDTDITALTMCNMPMMRKLGTVQLKGRTLSRAAVAFTNRLPFVYS